MITENEMGFTNVSDTGFAEMDNQRAQNYQKDKIARMVQHSQRNFNTGDDSFQLQKTSDFAQVNDEAKNTQKTEHEQQKNTYTSTSTSGSASTPAEKSTVFNRDLIKTSAQQSLGQTLAQGSALLTDTTPLTQVQGQGQSGGGVNAVEKGMQDNGWWSRVKLQNAPESIKMEVDLAQTNDDVIDSRDTRQARGWFGRPATKQGLDLGLGQDLGQGIELKREPEQGLGVDIDQAQDLDINLDLDRDLERGEYGEKSQSIGQSRVRVGRGNVYDLDNLSKTHNATGGLEADIFAQVDERYDEFLGRVRLLAERVSKLGKSSKALLARAVSLSKMLTAKSEFELLKTSSSVNLVSIDKALAKLGSRFQYH